MEICLKLEADFLVAPGYYGISDDRNNHNYHETLAEKMASKNEDDTIPQHWDFDERSKTEIDKKYYAAVNKRFEEVFGRANLENDAKPTEVKFGSVEVRNFK